MLGEQQLGKHSPYDLLQTSRVVERGSHGTIYSMVTGTHACMTCGW